MKQQVFSVETIDGIAAETLRGILCRAGFGFKHCGVKDVTTEPAEEEPTGTKKIFEIEFRGGHVGNAVDILSWTSHKGVARVKDVSKDVAILRGQEPKPSDEAVKEAKFILHGIGQSLPADQYDELVSRLTGALGGPKPEEEEAQPSPHGEGRSRCAKWADRAQKTFDKKDGEIKQLERQLSVCSIAVNGATESVAVRGDYAWSDAYQDVLDLRVKYDEAINKLESPTWGKSVVEQMNEYRDKLKDQGKSSILLSEVMVMWDTIRDCMEGGEFECKELIMAFETHGITIKNDIPGVKP